MNKNISFVLDTNGVLIHVVKDEEVQDFLERNTMNEPFLKIVKPDEVIDAPNDDMELQVCKVLQLAKIYDDFYHQLDGTYILDIKWGDWKHTHFWADHLLETTFGLKCISKYTTEQDGTDCYSAVHKYKLMSTNN